MDSRMTEGVLALSLVIVRCLGWKRVPDELRVQVQRVVRLAQREAEVIHCHDVFEEFAVVEVPDAASLAAPIERMPKGVGATIKAVVVE